MKRRGFCTSLGVLSATTAITALAAGCTGGSSGSTLASALVKVEKPDIVVAAVPSVSLAGLRRSRGLSFALLLRPLRCTQAHMC
jgi:hypothetical protein